MNKIYLLLFLLVLFSCKHETTKQQNILINDSIQTIFLPNPTYPKVENLIDSVKCIQLETNMECLLANIYKILANNGRFYIIDDRGEAIFIFRNNGEFLFKISNKGRGPKEYLKITDISFDPLTQKLIASDCFSKKIFVYNPNGILEKVIKVNFDLSYVTGLDSGKFVHMHSHCKEHIKEPILKNFDLQLLDSLGKMTVGIIRNQTPHCINIATPYCTSRTKQGSILYAPNLSDTIYHITKSGEVRAEYILQNATSKFKTIQPDLRSKISYNEQNKILLQLLDKDYLFYNGTLFNSPNILITEFGLHEKRKRLIYYKHNKKSILYDLENPKGEKILARISKYIIAQQHDTFYSTYAPAMLKLITEMENIPEKELKKYVTDLDENNNSIIFSFKFKELK